MRLFRIICEAVAAFHNCQPHPLAHRDLKTANILIDDNFNPIIMDLGNFRYPFTCYSNGNVVMIMINSLFFYFASGSATRARVEITNSAEARKLEDIAAERSSMPYRAPELFNIPSQTMIDERTDIWVRFM